VPFSLASENHQEKNAGMLQDKNAAIMILDKELPAKLEAGILELIFDEDELRKMRENISAFADREAAGKIARMLNEMVSNTANSSAK
jgi:UDP-N-acetylglucosamine--N-acetylmuramyl-(pentapeptide) pyrophosphoryl-undecaprenol N-acetylglucosamine transferase